VLLICEADFSPKKFPTTLEMLGRLNTFPPTSVYLSTAVTVHECTGGNVTSLTLYDKNSHTRCHMDKNLFRRCDLTHKNTNFRYQNE